MNPLTPRTAAAALAVCEFALAILIHSSSSASAGYGTTPALELPFPMGTQWNVSGFSYWSTQKCQNVDSTHFGLDYYAIDFGLTSGSEVDASAYGQVGAVGFDPSVAGVYIWIQHANNLQTYYGHLSSTPGDVYVATGQWVYQGQPIAKSDTTGAALGPHLHFRVSTGGTQPFNGSAYPPEPMSGTGPPGYLNWGNYGCAADNTTRFASTPPNVQVAIAPKGDGTEDLVLRGTNGAVYYSATDVNGTPLNWQSLQGVAVGTPCGVWDAGGQRFDVYVIGSDSYPYRITSTDGGTTWANWVRQGAAPSSGYSETESITCTRRPSGTVDLLMRGTSGDGIHMSANSNGDINSWDSLGGIVKGPPSGAWDGLQTRLDIYAIGSNDQPYHGVWSIGGWSGWTNVYVGAAGPAESEMINAARHPDGSMDVFVRGGGGQPGIPYYANTDASGNIGGWVALPGIVRGSPAGRAI